MVLYRISCEGLRTVKLVFVLIFDRHLREKLNVF